mmetsp:Transcript_21636/g.30256  ORF Transcript_21636/g.30256 Transcript_21636/m.30256 type:complete len:377 (-) Transcript_21636:31-1161(-)
MTSNKREEDLLTVEKDKQKGISPKNSRKDERRSSVMLLPATSSSNPIVAISPNGQKEKSDMTVNLRESSPPSFGSSTQTLSGVVSPSTEEIFMSGWMKIRNPMKMWLNRYFVLQPGKLIFYKDAEKDRVAGEIKLVNCDITEKGSNQNGCTFKLTNKMHQCIYVRAGFTEKSIKFTTNMVPTVNWTYCVFRVLTPQQRTDWINAISTQIHFANTHSLTKHETAVALTSSQADETLNNNNNVEPLEIDDEEMEETDEILGMNRGREVISRELAENLFQQNEALHKTLMDGLYENQRDVVKALHEEQIRSAEQLTKDINSKVAEMQNKIAQQTLTAMGVGGHKKAGLNLTVFQFVVLILLAILAGKLSDRFFTSNQEL